MFNDHLFCALCNTGTFITPVPAASQQLNSSRASRNTDPDESRSKISSSEEPKKLVFKKEPVFVSLSKYRRKCAVETCPNRVVQNGVCISHGKCSFSSFVHKFSS